MKGLGGKSPPGKVEIMEKVLIIENVKEKLENNDLYELGCSLLGSIVETITLNIETAIYQDSYDDMSYYITETENYNGSWYCSTFKAKNEVLENWDVFGDLLECYECEYGYKLDVNPFDEIEKLHCILMMFATEKVFNDFKHQYLENTEFVTVLETSYDSDSDTLKITYEE